MSIYRNGRPAKYRPTADVGTRPPEKPGEYRIRGEDDPSCILYIGETNNLNRRMHEHMRSGKLPAGGSFEYQVADGRSTSVTRREHERAKIGEHNPVLNRSSGGEGRIAGKHRR